jgi:hypothetical protein
MPRASFGPLRRMLPVLAALLTSCASAPMPWAPSASPSAMKPAEIPPLPSQARQPVTRELCSPTCSDGLRRRLESWLP